MSSNPLDSLVKTVNKLQDAFLATGVSNPLDLPQIVVIGSQSSGKSSVLENIVGKDFLPRGSGIVTRRPLVLQLINKQPENGEEKEWAEFLHKPGERFTDFDKVRQEIVSDTEKITGKNAGISSVPINLRITSPNLLTLTLVDLPGLTKVPVGDQPADIEKQIREMVFKHISKPNAIILAVTSANTDLANSDGLKMAREVDPEGLRTLGVLTKIDLMDPGTDVIDILAGRVIPLRLGYVPVVNRGQRDIETNKKISIALEKEKEFFESHASYGSKAAYCGTPFLAKKLSMLLMHHIRNTLPDIKSKISSDLQKYVTELSALGGTGSAYDTEDQSQTLLHFITEFCKDFRGILDGNGPEINTTELSGGARISFVFHETFANGIQSINGLENVKDTDIRTIMYNSSGSAPSLFVGTTAFEVIIRQQIRKLEDPSLKCCTMVQDELLRILNSILAKPNFKRYPALKEKFFSIVSNFFKQAMVPTTKLVQDLIAAEIGYINTGHPDFISGHKAVAMVQEKLYPPQPPAGGSITPGQRPGSAAPNVPIRPSPVKREEVEEGSGFFGSFMRKDKPKPRSGYLEAVPTTLRAGGNLSERETTETEVIKILLDSYFNVVKRTIADMVPKAIILNLVAHSKEHIQRELLMELYSKTKSSEGGNNLLQEDEGMVERRKDCKRMIEALQKAEEIVSAV